MNKTDFILFSGGAPGAEAEFGACAERHGIEEVNFTFDGHNEARRRGVRVLNHEELQAGDVSLEYVSRLMHRRYTDSPTIRKVLQTLWYQVNNGQEIYVIGVDPGRRDRARRHRLGRRVREAVQQAAVRLRSGQGRLVRVDRRATGRPRQDAPTITHPHFTGTGTRKIHDNGKRAIEELFTQSFETVASRSSAFSRSSRRSAAALVELDPARQHALRARARSRRSARARRGCARRAPCRTSVDAASSCSRACSASSASMRAGSDSSSRCSVERQLASAFAAVGLGADRLPRSLRDAWHRRRARHAGRGVERGRGALATDPLPRLPQVVLVPADVLRRRRLPFERERAGHDVVEEHAIVADEQHRAVELADQLLEQLQRLDVEIVGRLVEHQHVGRPREQPREQQPVALAARQRLAPATARARAETGSPRGSR